MPVSASRSNPFIVRGSDAERSAMIKMINGKEQSASCECGRSLTETDAKTESDQSADPQKFVENNCSVTVRYMKICQGRFTSEERATEID